MLPDGGEELGSFLRFEPMPCSVIVCASIVVCVSSDVAGVSAFVAPAIAMPLSVPIAAANVGENGGVVKSCVRS